MVHRSIVFISGHDSLTIVPNSRINIATVCRGFKDLRVLSTKDISKHSVVSVITGFIVFIIVTPAILSAYKPNQLQTNQMEVSASSIDLNDMMLRSWKYWDALLTRWLCLNGTLVDTRDYTLRNWGTPSNISLSGISFYSLVLISMYEQTGNNYYLSKLQTIIKGLIENPFCYADVYIAGVGNINVFHIPALYFSEGEHDYDPTPTMLTAFAAVKLWKLTQTEKFRQLAERVANESLLLAAINNSTDLAWSRYYSWGRDINNAKQWTWRQTPITLFYTLYGREIDPTYLTYVNRTLHWQFQAQLPSGGFADSIGETAPDKAHTGIQMMLLALGYRISAEQYVGYRTNMANALFWLQSLPIDFAYMENYAVTAGLINSWKANFTVDLGKAKTAAYLGLKALDFTNYGVFPKSGIDPDNGMTYVAYGWRWPQSFMASFLSTYPLPDGSLQTSDITELVDSSAGTEDQDIVYGWKTALGFDRLRIDSPYGTGLWQWRGTSPQGGALYFLFGWKLDPPFETPVSPSIVDRHRYFLNIKSIYSSSVIDLQVYASGVTTAQVAGATTFSMLQWSQGRVNITLADRKTRVLNDFVPNSSLDLGNAFVIQQTDSPTQFFFIRSSNSTWTTYNQTSLLQLKTTLSNGGKFLLARLQAEMSASDAFDLFDYATYFDQASPITFTQMVESYVQLKNNIGERNYGTPSWKPAYENATDATGAEEEKVKFIALDFPEIVNLSYWNFTAQNLTATLSGVPGVNSALKIYSGYRFSPLKVFINDVEQNSGTVWSFDKEFPATRIFSVSITFSSPSIKLDVFFSEDTTAPSILSVERSIQYPQYNDTVTISADITDNESGVGKVVLNYWNGTYWLNTTMPLNLNNSLYEGEIPPLPYATEVQYTVYAADRAQNGRVRAETYYSYVVIDTYQPSVSIFLKHLLPNGTRILKPAEGDYASGTANITVYCQEPNLEKMELYIDNASTKLWTSNETGSYLWNTTALIDGSSHILKVIANDLAGNSANTTATVFPDNTPPLIGIPNWNPRSPAPNEDVTVTVSITDATSGIDSANILYRRTGQGTIQIAKMMFGDGVWSGIIPGQPDEVGIILTIEAFDKAENRAQTQSASSYNVGYSSLPIVLLVIIVGISVGIILVGAFVYYRKHRKPQNDKLAQEQGKIKKM